MFAVRKKNIELLAESIKKRGLLQPVTVYKKDGKYELIIGQRRFLAFQHLGYDKIPCIVVDSYEDVLYAKMDSLTENEIREEMELRDKIEICTELYHKYGSVKAVAEELGWSPSLVSKYVKSERLPGILKEEVREGRMNMGIALQVIDALSPDGRPIDEQKAYELALELQRMSPSERASTYGVIKSHPDQPVEKIIEKGKEPKAYTDITLKLFIEDFNKAKRYAEDQKKESVESALIDLIKEGLQRIGY